MQYNFGSTVALCFKSLCCMGDWRVLFFFKHIFCSAAAQMTSKQVFKSRFAKFKKYWGSNWLVTFKYCNNQWVENILLIQEKKVIDISCRMARFNGPK